MTPYDVVIVGGGLSGLLIARQIHTYTPSKTWKLIEGRPTFGGRLENDQSGNNIDLGGAWIWPMHQPHISNLVKSLDIKTFDQPDDLSSTRIVGGAAEIVRRIEEQLPKERIQLNSPVKHCKRAQVSTNDTCANDKDDLSHYISVELESGEHIHARRVVLAVPPKIVSQQISFDPPLSVGKRTAMEQSQTWMAGVTKVALVYKEPRFWPLSVSNGGFRPAPNRPAFQVYDASPEDDSELSALTFFTLASLSNAASKDDDDDATLARHCAEQIASHLESSAGAYVPDVVVAKIKSYDEFHVKRWPKEKYISEDDNPRGINPHPEPLSALAKNEWDGKLLFGGTECDMRSPGVMEGAVGAAIHVFNELERLWR